MPRRRDPQDLNPEEQYREAIAERVCTLLELPGLRKVDPFHREIASEIIRVVRLHDPIIHAAKDVVMHRTMPSRYVVKLAEAFVASIKK